MGCLWLSASSSPLKFLLAAPGGKPKDNQTPFSCFNPWDQVVATGTFKRFRATATEKSRLAKSSGLGTQCTRPRAAGTRSGLYSSPLLFLACAPVWFPEFSLLLLDRYPICLTCTFCLILVATFHLLTTGLVAKPHQEKGNAQCVFNSKSIKQSHGIYLSQLIINCIRDNLPYYWLAPSQTYFTCHLLSAISGRKGNSSQQCLCSA